MTSPAKTRLAQGRIVTLLDLALVSLLYGINTALAFCEFPDREPLRGLCANRSCTVRHRGALHATDAPVSC